MAEAATSAEFKYQDIFTAFFVDASKVEAHYYSLKELLKDIPNLARLMGVSQENFQTLLVLASGLGFKRMAAHSSFPKPNLIAS
jgi:hypothetical protein